MAGYQTAGQWSVVNERGDQQEVLLMYCILKTLVKTFILFQIILTDEKLNVLYDMLACNSGLNQRVHEVEQHISVLQTEHDSTKLQLKLLQYKSIDQETRSRRNNLIFRGIEKYMPRKTLSIHSQSS